MFMNKESHLKVDEKYCHIFTIHDCFMFPAPLYNSILEGYKSVLINLKLNTKIENLFSHNNISIKDDAN